MRQAQLRYYIDTTLEYIRSSIRREAEGKNAVFFAAHDLIMATGDTLEGKLLASLGLSNPAQKAVGWILPEEQAAALAPDVIFYSDAVGQKTLEDSPYYQNSPAVQGGRTVSFEGGVF